MPSNSSIDRIISAAKQLIQAINNPAPPVPFEHVDKEESMALEQLAQIFSDKAPSQRVVTPSQKVVAPSQRVINSHQQITPQQKLMLERATQSINLK